MTGTDDPHEGEGAGEPGTGPADGLAGLAGEADLGLGDPEQDPDGDDEDAHTTFNPDDPQTIGPGPAPRTRAVPAPTCRAALEEATGRFPARSRISDGIMGDQSHQARKSDHNEGNAFDLTHDPAHGCDAHGLVEGLKHARDPRVKYLISNKRIWNPSVAPDWRPYTGKNPHNKHAHVSIHVAARDSTRAWWAGAGEAAPDVTAAGGSAPPVTQPTGTTTPEPTPPPPPIPEPETDMPEPTDVTDEIDYRGAILQLTFDGGIKVLDRDFKPHPDVRSVVGPDPFSYPGLPEEARQGKRGFFRLRPDPGGDGYTLVATDGSHYHFPV